MPDRRLSAAELETARAILTEFRERISAAACGEVELRFAPNRKVFKELSYDERSKPAHRVALKRRKRKAQEGRCAVCAQLLPPTDVHLDREQTILGYTDANTRLICRPCDLRIQPGRGFA